VSQSGAEARLDADSRSPWLKAVDLSKNYGGVTALKQTSVQIHPGEIRGLVGANGAGKSTLVKILTGVTAPTSGAVYIDDAPLKLGRPKESLQAGIVSVPQELTIAPTMTVAENIFMGHYPHYRPGFLRPRELRKAATAVLDRLELPIHPDQIAGELSVIFQRLVMVARAFSFEARLMIFDEPTATISPREVEFLLDAITLLSKQGVSILYVSHRLDEVDAICSGVTVLRDGEVVADLTAEDATHTALVEHLVGASPTESSSATPPARCGSEEVVLELQGVEGTRLDGVSLKVNAREIVGLAGVTGSGTRELLLTICGALPFHEGSITLCGDRVRSGNPPAAVSAGIGFLPGDRSLAAFPSHSIRFNVSLPTLARNAKLLFVNRQAERSAVAALLDRVALRRDPETQISALSGGNQQKAIVARWLGAKPKLLLLDDPTAGVDVATRPDIHNQIRSACTEGAGVLLLSTDMDELTQVADRVLVFRSGSITDELHDQDLTTSRVLAAMTSQQSQQATPSTGAEKGS
jgi:ABC-type sugar transport system ATPase subunit